jgi:hypothetical protein
MKYCISTYESRKSLCSAATITKTYSKNPIGGKTPISLLTGFALSDELLDCVEEGAKAEADAKVRANGSNRTMFTDFQEQENRSRKIDKISSLGCWDRRIRTWCARATHLRRRDGPPSIKETNTAKNEH